MINTEYVKLIATLNRTNTYYKAGETIEGTTVFYANGFRFFNDFANSEGIVIEAMTGNYGFMEIVDADTAFALISMDNPSDNDAILYIVDMVRYQADETFEASMFDVR